jgi:hypothetical protein
MQLDVGGRHCDYMWIRGATELNFRGCLGIRDTQVGGPLTYSEEQVALLYIQKYEVLLFKLGLC